MRMCSGVLLVVLTLTTTSPAGEVRKGVNAAMEKLAAKARAVRAVVKKVLGATFEAQVGSAIDELKEDPRSLRLQLRVIDILIVQADKLSDSLRKTKDSDLAGLRDRVVKGLEALVKTTAAKRDRYRVRAKETDDREWRQRYEKLAGVMDQLAQAHALRAGQYKAVPITKQLFQVQMALEYLDSLKETLSELRDGIEDFLTDEEALRELQKLSATVDGIQKSLKKFADVVLAGAIAGEDRPAPTTQKPKGA